MNKTEQIMQELQDLMRLDDVLACMLAKKGLEGIIPTNMKIKQVELFKLIRDTTNELFDVIDQFYDYGLDRLNMDLTNYTIIIAPVSRGFGLIVVIPALANLGLLDVEIENTRRRIKTIVMTEESSPISKIPSNISF